MNVLLEILPLPKEIIHFIASYDRVLSIKPIPKTDTRYNILLNIPSKHITYYEDLVVRGWIVRFAKRSHILSMVFQEKQENIYTYINTVNDDRCGIYLWE